MAAFDQDVARPVSLSNRRETPPKNRDSVVGIDRLSLSFPLTSWENDPGAWNNVSTRLPGTPQAAETRGGTVELVPGVKAFVGVQALPTGQTWGKVEFNPSRVVDPDGVSLAPVEALADVIPLVMRKAEALVVSATDQDHLKVKRLDVARDFHDVPRPDFYVRGLGPVQRPWARRNLVHFDPQRKGAQTLMVGSGAGVVRLYDKHAETQGKAPEGTLRWETEARSGWAENYGGIKNVADLNRAAVERLAQNRWEWSAMGVEVTATARVIERVQRSGLTAAKQRSFLGYLLLRSQGISSPLSNDTAAEFNKLVRDLGVTLATDEAESMGFVGRLDFVTGTEIVRAA